MKNIIWEDLIQNIIRCIIAYPLFLIALVISIPLNIIGWVIAFNYFNNSLYPIKGS